VRDIVRLLNQTAAIGESDRLPEDTMARAQELVCDLTGWPLAHVYLIEGDSNVLWPTRIWRTDDAARVSPFVEETMRTPMPAGTGLPGRVLKSGEPLWALDLAADPRAASAAASGITGGVGSPIVSAQGIEGVMEFFPPSTQQPDEPLLDLLSHVGVEVGIALERMRGRSALRASQMRLAQAERLGRMGTWLYDIERDVLEWSEELRVLYGLDPSVAPASLDSLLARVHPDDVARVRATILESIGTGASFEHEYRLLIRPDDLRWAHSRGDLVTRGRSPFLVGYCQDTTEQRMREQAERRGREQLAEAQQLARLGSWSWDVVSNDVTCSDELLRIAGLHRDGPSANLETFLSLVHLDDRPVVDAAVMQVVHSQEPFDLVVRIVRPSGEQRWIHSHGESVEQADGRARRVAGYAQDVTERRAAEEERARLEAMLHQSQRLEGLGQLAGGVAHDFNNLLSVILSYSAFVREGLTAMAEIKADPRCAALLADVQQIARAGLRGAELTRRLLAFGRREVVRPIVLVVNDVVREIEPLLRRTIGPHLELRTRLAADLWPIKADPGQLEQVLLNLAINARDALPGVGALTIETANVEGIPDARTASPAVRSGRHVRLRFSDNGPGMSKEVLERAFEPFFTTKPKGEGSGLGLATVHGIVAQAGGGVRIDSQLGAGTVVTMAWPATDEAQIAIERVAPGHVARATGETVLVVEDEAALREVTRRILSRHGYSVLTASGGIEAIALARHHHGDIDVLVTDIIMPVMLGKDVAAAVTALRPGVPVIYMSGYARSMLMSNGSLERGVVLLEKPIAEDDLLRTVRQVLEGARSSRPRA
jgi:PAS domain S-box-containing protein